MKIATWNVNSVKARLPHLIAWLNSENPDCLALQETKVLDEAFPRAAFEDLGYFVVFTGEKAYNGVAIVTKKPAEVLACDLPGEQKTQRRFLAVKYEDYTIVNVYVPNGQSIDSPKYTFKLAWLADLHAYLKHELTTNQSLVVLGDFNIAPCDQDIADPKAWEGQVLASPAEREAFMHLLDLGLVDLYRAHYPEDKAYSWWDYRAAAFRRNLGLRIDHILTTPALQAQCKGIWIDKTPRAWERPSDHTPVLAEFL